MDLKKLDSKKRFHAIYKSEQIIGFMQQRQKWYFDLLTLFNRDEDNRREYFYRLFLVLANCCKHTGGNPIALTEFAIGPISLMTDINLSGYTFDMFQYVFTNKKITAGIKKETKYEYNQKSDVYYLEVLPENVESNNTHKEDSNGTVYFNETKMEFDFERVDNESEIRNRLITVP